MAEIHRLFRRAIRYHEAGRLAEAENAYRAILAEKPDHADSLHGIGVLAHLRGRSDLAIGFIGRALELNPRQAHYHINLGRALRERGHVEEARAAFHVAVLLTPEDAVAQFDLAVVLAELGRVAEALDGYRTALRLDPFFAEACANTGLLLHAVGNLHEAEASFRRLAGLRPGDAEAHGVWAVLLRQLGRLADSEMPLRAATRLDPGNAEWLNLLGATLIDLLRADEAVAPLGAALLLKPDHVDAHNNLGLALQAAGRLDEASAQIGEALRLQPDNADIRNNLGTLLRELGRLQEAEHAWRDVVARDPQHAPAQFNLATLRLAEGKFAAGWPGFEWRDRIPGGRVRAFPQPRWTGEISPGSVVLVHAEQGFGDTIQFCRYAALAARRARIVLEVPRSLLRLLAGLDGIEQVVEHGAPLPAFDAHCPMLSLPGVFGTSLETIPTATPYLTAPDGAAWEARLAGLDGLRVGLCWAGSRAYRQDRRRSLTIADLGGLASVAGVDLVSLQKDPPQPPDSKLHDWMAEIGDFADTASLISRLDVVISVDTAVAHLAGALAKPVWLLNRFDSDWRWLRDRDDSPWYPTLRQFRQPCPGDWAAVTEQVAAALADAAHAGRRPAASARSNA